MFNTLKPPTDNLYKFIAIAGLVCFVLGVVLAVQQTRKTLDTAYAAEDELQEAWLTLGDGFEDGDDETAFELLNDAWKNAIDGEDTFGLTQEARKLGTLNEESLAAVRRFEIAAERLADQRQMQDAVNTYLVWLLSASLLFMLGGFVAWYFQTQRYQDKLLKLQTQERLPVEQQDGPANAGRKWTEAEEEKLRKGFDDGKRYKQLAKDHGRTPGAIKARLVKLGLIDDPSTQGTKNP